MYRLEWEQLMWLSFGSIDLVFHGTYSTTLFSHGMQVSGFPPDIHLLTGSGLELDVSFLAGNCIS